MATKLPQMPIVFRDTENIYLEFLATPTYPKGFVLKFPFTEGGFAKACKHIPNIAPPGGHTASAQRVLAIKQERQVKLVKGKKPQKYEKAKAQALLDKLGLRPKP